MQRENKHPTFLWFTARSWGKRGTWASLGFSHSLILYSFNKEWISVFKSCTSRRRKASMFVVQMDTLTLGLT